MATATATATEISRQLDLIEERARLMRGMAQQAMGCCDDESEQYEMLRNVSGTLATLLAYMDGCAYWEPRQ